MSRITKTIPLFCLTIACAPGEPTAIIQQETPPDTTIVMNGLYNLYAVNDTLVDRGPRGIFHVAVATRPCGFTGMMGIDSLLIGPQGELDFQADGTLTLWYPYGWGCYLNTGLWTLTSDRADVSGTYTVSGSALPTALDLMHSGDVTLSDAAARGDCGSFTERNGHVLLFGAEVNLKVTDPWTSFVLTYRQRACD